ncbi:MAG: hypothetical protein L0229_13870 [Blastocatellia bacterium]|nr:hypothetical protein [Blastocatellia bacterium]
MPATLEIEKETAEMLAAQAEARGISVDDYLRSLLKDKAASEEEVPLSPLDRARLWREWVDNHSITATPLSDYALTRESIYAEREDKQS